MRHLSNRGRMDGGSVGARPCATGDVAARLARSAAMPTESWSTSERGLDRQPTRFAGSSAHGGADECRTLVRPSSPRRIRAELGAIQAVAFSSLVPKARLLPYHPAVHRNARLNFDTGPPEEPALHRRHHVVRSARQPERAIELPRSEPCRPRPPRHEHAELMDTGNFEAARAWMEALGDEAPRHYPPVGVAAAWVWAMAGDGPRALRSVLAAERGALDGGFPDGDSSLASGAAMIRAAMAPLGVEQMLLDAERAFELEPPGRPRHPVAAMLLGNARLMNGDTDGAVTAFERSIHLGRELQPATAQFGLAPLALIAAQRNDWAVAGSALRNRIAEPPPIGGSLTALSYSASAVAARPTSCGAMQDVGEAVRSRERSPAASPGSPARARSPRRFSSTGRRARGAVVRPLRGGISCGSSPSGPERSTESLRNSSRRRRIARAPAAERQCGDLRVMRCSRAPLTG